MVLVNGQVTGSPPSLETNSDVVDFLGCDNAPPLGGTTETRCVPAMVVVIIGSMVVVVDCFGEKYPLDSSVAAVIACLGPFRTEREEKPSLNTTEQIVAAAVATKVMQCRIFMCVIPGNSQIKDPFQQQENGCLFSLDLLTTENTGCVFYVAFESTGGDDKWCDDSYTRSQE